MSAPSEPTPARLSILLPVHNRRETTVRCVQMLRDQTWRDFRLVLIDDGSTDGTAAAVQALLPEVEIVRGRGHWWWAGSLQQGCRHLACRGMAEEDVVLLLNDDVVLGPRFLADALAELALLPDTLLLARQVDAATGADIDGGGGVHADLRELRFTAARTPAEINCLPTRGLFLRWRDLCRVGGFRPEWLPHYFSDYEFTLRAGARGLALRVARTATLGVQIEQSGRSLANLAGVPRGQRLSLLFSRRFKDNPCTWSAFVWLAAPPPRKCYLWLKIWVHFLVSAPAALLRPTTE
jgi:GT2 family glycosyltransferase